jgi:hypothetical protein
MKNITVKVIPFSLILRSVNFIKIGTNEMIPNAQFAFEFIL